MAYRSPHSTEVLKTVLTLSLTTLSCILSARWPYTSIRPRRLSLLDHLLLSRLWYSEILETKRCAPWRPLCNAGSYIFRLIQHYWCKVYKKESISQNTEIIEQVSIFKFQGNNANRQKTPNTPQCNSFHTSLSPCSPNARWQVQWRPELYPRCLYPLNEESYRHQWKGKSCQESFPHQLKKNVDKMDVLVYVSALEQASWYLVNVLQTEEPLSCS